MSRRLQRQGRNHSKEKPRTLRASDLGGYSTRVVDRGNSESTPYHKPRWNYQDKLDKRSSDDESDGSDIYFFVDQLSIDDDDEVDFVSNGIF